MKPVRIYTDGGCRGNPGPGAWAAILTYGGDGRELFRKELSGYEPETTNNRMELMAAIAGLSALNQTCAVEVVTDSKYLADGASRYLPNWIRNGWRTASKDPVKNTDLWILLAALLERHSVEWVWVKGHAGHPENERCDSVVNAVLDAAGRRSG